MDGHARFAHHRGSETVPDGWVPMTTTMHVQQKAGSFPVRATMDAPSRTRLGGQCLQHVPLGGGDSPWGPVAVVADGSPLGVEAAIAGEPVLRLVATVHAKPDSGPVSLDVTPPPHLEWHGHEAGVLFVAEGHALRGGRKRFVRVAGAMSSWTFRLDAVAGREHSSTTNGRVPSGVRLGLRRGPDPDGYPVVRIAQTGIHGEGTVSWSDDVSQFEVALALVLWLATDEVRLWPLWARVVDFAHSGHGEGVWDVGRSEGGGWAGE